MHSSSIAREKKIELSLDISRFASGRDGKATDTLEGFLKYFDQNNGFIKENVASISDEEILFSDKLPDCTKEYDIDAYEGVILKKICLRLLEKKEIKESIEIELADGESQNGRIDENTIKKLKEKITEVNNKNHPVWEIVEGVKNNIKKSKMNQDDLKELKVNSGSDDSFYNKLEKLITIKVGKNI